MNGYIELQPWPPRRQACNNLLGDTIKLCCSLWSIFCLGWFSLQFVPPWSLHVLLEIKCDGVQLWPFFCSYAVLVLMNTSALVVPPRMSFRCIQIADGSLVWSFIMGTNTTGTYTSGAAPLSVADDGFRCDPCALLRQLDSAKAQRNLHMQAPVCLIAAQVILVPWKFWPWFTRYTSDRFLQLTGPWSLGVWACSSARMIACSVLLGALLVAQSVTLEFSSEWMMLDMGFLTTSKEVRYSVMASA